MKILVTGSNGQLGKELQNLIDGIFTSRNELDITIKSDVENFIYQHNITHIINCAAYTQVDNAENEPDKAFLINTESLKNLVEIAKKINIRIIHISTDFVFDGKKNTPYTENDKPNPLSVYGKSKYRGEEILVNANINYAIIRTSWLYSIYGNNFVKTIIKYAKEKKELNVVYDQVGTPTYAWDLANIISRIVFDNTITGIYHYSNEGVASWYDFAKAIVDIAGIECKIHPILTHEYKRLAIRPPYSVLHKQKIKEQLKLDIPYWRDSLYQCITKLKKNNNI